MTQDFKQQINRKLSVRWKAFGVLETIKKLFSLNSSPILKATIVKDTPL